MNPPTAQKTNFTYDGRSLYRIEGHPCRLFLLKTYGAVEAYLDWQKNWRRFRFERCPEAEAELEHLGWVRTEPVWPGGTEPLQQPSHSVPA